MPQQEFQQSLSYRRELVHTLYREGNLHSARVAVAFLCVPREAFVPGLPLDEVYRPAEAIVVKRVGGATLSSASAPEVIAVMLEQLNARPGNRVLEIGAGTGYNAALLAQLVGEDGSVTTVDIDEEMVLSAREHLASAGVDRVTVVHSDGALGHPEGLTCDRIILTASSNDIAPAWWQQLAPRGCLVMPLALRGLQRCVAFTPAEDGALVCHSLRTCAFITLRGSLGARAGQAPTYVGGRWVANGDEQNLPLRAPALAEVLSGPLLMQRTGVSLSVEQLRHGLHLWLVAHDRDVYSVWGDERLPDLFGYAERIGTHGTLCLLGLPQASLALLAWADESAPGGELSVLAPAGGKRLGERLAALVQDWATRARPMDADVEIRAYPRADGPALSLAEVQDGPEHAVPGSRPLRLGPDTVVLDQRWTRFVLSWR